MLVAVGRSVACRNSAMISRPEKPCSAPHGSSAYASTSCLPLHSAIASLSDHAPFGSSVMRACGKSLGQRFHCLHLFRARQHAAFQLEVVESVLRLRRFSQPHNRLRRKRLFIAQPKPSVAPTRPRADNRDRSFGCRPQKTDSPAPARSCAAALRRAARQRELRETDQADRAARTQSPSSHESSRADRRSAGRARRIAIGKALVHLVENRVIGRDLAAHNKRREPLPAPRESFRRRELRPRRCCRLRR